MVLCVSEPLVPVTVMVEVIGVPDGCGRPKPAPHPVSEVSAITARARHSSPRHLRRREKGTRKKTAASTGVASRQPGRGRLPSRCAVWVAAVWIVMTLAAPALLGVTDAGEKETDAPAGRPLARKELP